MSIFISLTLSAWVHTWEIFRITCDNSTSLEWLGNTVFWESAKLDVVGQLLKLTKPTARIPGEPEDLWYVAWRDKTPGYR